MNDEERVVVLLALRPGHPEEGIIMPGGKIGKCDWCGCDVNINPNSMTAALGTAHSIGGVVKPMCRPCAKVELRGEQPIIAKRSEAELEEFRAYFRNLIKHP